MKKLLLLFTICTGFLFGNNVIAQDKNTCLGIVKEIEKDLDDLDPAESINQKLFTVCDKLRDIVTAGQAKSYYMVQEYLKEIQEIVEDAKKGKCTSSDCSKAKSNVNKIKKEMED